VKLFVDLTVTQVKEMMAFKTMLAVETSLQGWVYICYFPELASSVVIKCDLIKKSKFHIC